MTKKALSFKPIEVVKRLLKSLPKRSREVIEMRYGVGKSAERQTLEGIGKKYGITRERVRQIEDHAINLIRESDGHKKEKNAFGELQEVMDNLGSVVAENELLDYTAKDDKNKNAVHLMLVVGDEFTKEKEDDNFKHRWYVDSDISEKVKESLRQLYKNLDDDQIIPESELITQFLNNISDISDKYRDDEIIKRWLSLSKKMDKNPLGEWGKSDSHGIHIRGVRDYAYLVLRKKGTPTHFRDIAKVIYEFFNKRVHVATCHNELIRDPRFVLVGRGMYALSEWGYSTGVVKDVIERILKDKGPMTKQEIIDSVRKERIVKDSTILVNLQDSNRFSRQSDGKFSVAKN